jgi:hypothetical protein
MAVDVCGVSRLNSIVGSFSILSRKSVVVHLLLSWLCLNCFLLFVLLLSFYLFSGLWSSVLFFCVLCKESVDAWLAWQTHQVGGNVCVFFHYYYRRHLYS